MSKVKLCGLRSLKDIDIVNQYRPDFIGFVFSKSKRRVTKAQAQAMRGRLAKEILSVGVFVNEPVSTIADLVQDGIINAVQLHGNEDADYMALLKLRIACPVIKAVRVRHPKDIINAQVLPCDFLLLDTYSKESYGGTGRRFDWNIIPQTLAKPFFLAGGIDWSNVMQAVKAAAPYCVDVSSGVETNGCKDRAKIEKLIHLVRSAEYEKR